MGCRLPECICKRAGSWFGTSVCIERMTQHSSMTEARWGRLSLTSMPLCPWRRNRRLEGKKPRPLDFL